MIVEAGKYNTPENKDRLVKCLKDVAALYGCDDEAVESEWTVFELDADAQRAKAVLAVEIQKLMLNPKLKLLKK